MGRNRPTTDAPDTAERGVGPEDAEGDGVQTFPETTHSRVDLIQKTGMRPEEYLHELLAERGTMRQQRFQTLSGLTSSSTSRLLSELESEGSITRCRVGREKVIAHPEDAFVSSSERGVAVVVATLSLKLQSRLPGSVNRLLSRLVSPTVNGLFWFSTRVGVAVGSGLEILQRLWLRFPM